MDHLSAQLMEDVVLEQKKGPKSNISSARNTIVKPTKDVSKPESSPRPSMNLKVEMQTLRIAEESEKQLYETLKHIYGSSFKMTDITEFENKKSNLGKQYWMERGNLVIKGVLDYSSKDTTPKTQEQITRQFATSKLETYSFHSSHCIEALMHASGHMGNALEILFSKYYGTDELPKREDLSDLDYNEILERRDDEKLALESIYGDMFTEKIKNQIWIIKLKLNYLLKKQETKTMQKPKKENKELCRLFLHGKCRFGPKCKFLHQQPEPVKPEPIREDPYFTLEIRFPEGCMYPYEPPYLYFSKNETTYPKIECLRIARRLYDEAQQLCIDGTPSIFSLISLLENEYDIKSYLEENKEQFIDKDDPLFPKSSEDDSNDAPTHYEKGSTRRRDRNNIPWQEIVKQDDEIQQKFMEKQRNSRYLKMKEVRRKLPAWSRMNAILEIIDENPVTIISGETGCGKSTQVPQFILDNWIVNRYEESKSHVEIICTQPRRISAIGVSERVAAERDERIGNTIGYQIRLENKMSNWTRLTFCTTGILLQRFSSDPQLKSVTHIIVDEVHERSAESDFLLMLLKQLLPKRPDLKIILMSATLKADAFSTYFGNVPVLDIPGRTFPVEQIFLEDILERTNFVLEENSKYTRKVKGGWEQLEIDLESADVESLSSVVPRDNVVDDNLTLAQLFGRYEGYSRRTYKNLYVMDHEKINFDLLEKTLEWIVNGDHEYPKTGSILVFLPGFAEIIALRDSLCDNKILSPKAGKFVVVPLHSTLSSEEQSLVFRKMKEGVRKIVLSTNISETSVTIDDCVFVVDTGKMKETRFNSNQNMESLEMCWVSRANAMQRKGRAGRVMPGVSIHLYTSHRFKHHFLAQPIPEILRIPLEPLLLRIQIMHKGKKVNLHDILDKVLEPPSKESVTDAIKRLQDVGAFDPECVLTPLGHHLATLPVDVRIGKLILFGSIFCCVDSALTIAACLSHKSPFVAPFDKKHEVDKKKKEFATANSDQLTILKAYRKWLETCSHSFYAGQVFANENFLSVRTLHTLADIKHQFLELLVSIGFVPADVRKRQMGSDKILETTGFELNVNNENFKLLQGLLCAALYPNVVKVFTPEKSFQIQSSGAIPRQPKPEELRFQTKNDGFVNIHPSSVNFSVGHFPSPYLVFQEKIKTSRIFIREISMVPMLSLILFSGYGINIELHNGTVILSLGDGWIMFRVESHRVAQLLQRMRIELVKLLEQKMQDPLLNLLNHQNGKKIIHTIVNIVTRD
ncbi:putative ATP-dependent RNA helicase DHX57 [Cephus cinctus]|uniref:Putative ATP-dependent RNA helicase DHX57 n=1 Tax=Cephus cinctus TaxID=211228 RepID=A0AAJ7RAD5_CEPCN|nr:putative ATP-dependent RNA helicase DHX57 [Cephus cinctus]XP_024937301.1 putative ATP-dependent RNA helicase DHX57 [Cephus cinctus]